MVKVVEKGYRMEAPEGCPPEIYEIMRQVMRVFQIFSNRILIGFVFLFMFGVPVLGSGSG